MIVVLLALLACAGPAGGPAAMPVVPPGHAVEPEPAASDLPPAPFTHATDEERTVVVGGREYTVRTTTRHYGDDGALVVNLVVRDRSGVRYADDRSRRPDISYLERYMNGGMYFETLEVTPLAGRRGSGLVLDLQADDGKSCIGPRHEVTILARRGHALERLGVAIRGTGFGIVSTDRIRFVVDNVAVGFVTPLEIDWKNGFRPFRKRMELAVDGQGDDGAARDGPELIGEDVLLHVAPGASSPTRRVRVSGHVRALRAVGTVVLDAKGDLGVEDGWVLVRVGDEEGWVHDVEVLHALGFWTWC